MTPGVKYSALITDHFIDFITLNLKASFIKFTLDLVLVKAVELEIRECHVRAGQLHRALEREVGQTLDPVELVLTGQLLVERLNVDLEADVFPKPLCPGCGDEGGLLQVGVELAVALALGPQLHAELDGETSGQKQSCALLATALESLSEGTKVALEAFKLFY